MSGSRVHNDASIESLRKKKSLKKQYFRMTRSPLQGLMEVDLEQWTE